jgi:putative membrane protein
MSVASACIATTRGGGSMFLDAALSVFHFVFVFIVVGALSAEAFLLRLPLDARVARQLLRADLFYGASAVGLILAGAARLTWGAKGWEHYAAQPFFWAKMATFALVGIVSVWPTLAYFRWVKAAGADANAVVGEAEAKRVRRFVAVELHALALVVVFAALMARGIGG